MAGFSGLEEQAIQYRGRHLQFLSALGFGVAVAMAVLTIAWGMWDVVVPSLFYAPICFYVTMTLRRHPERIGALSNLFIFATMFVTQSGVFLQRPDAITDPWLLTVPLVAYGLCDRRIAAGWTALTIVLLTALRPWMPHTVAAPQTTIVLVLAIVAFATAQHLYSRRMEDNERLIVELSNTDSLTGALNRRALDKILEAEYRRNLRQQSAMTVLMLDVDHFKRYNDDRGHIEGDRVLAEVGRALKQTARRSGDFVFRYGGEEFCVICSGLDEAQSGQFAEQLRSSVESLRMAHGGAPAGVVTASIGLRFAARVDNTSPARLIAEADKALYLAKQRGRNRVERFAA